MQLNHFLALSAVSVACLSPAFAMDKAEALDNWFKVGIECMEKLQAELAKVKDKASADKAAPEVKAANEKLKKLAEETGKFYKSPAEFERALMTKPDKLQKVIALGQKLAQENDRMTKAKYYESTALKEAQEPEAKDKKTADDKKSPAADKKS